MFALPKNFVYLYTILDATEAKLLKNYIFYPKLISKNYGNKQS